jgi:hypothetical protein
MRGVPIIAAAQDSIGTLGKPATDVLACPQRQDQFTIIYLSTPIRLHTCGLALASRSTVPWLNMRVSEMYLTFILPSRVFSPLIDCCSIHGLR